MCTPDYLRKTLIKAVLLCAAITTANYIFAADITVTNIGAEEGGFPWITGGKNRVSDRINDELFKDIFDIQAPSHSNPSLKNIDFKGMELGGFKVLRNDKQILSLLIEGEGCGAYCESFERSFVFDVSTGRQLNAEDLLTVEGKGALARKSHEAAANTIRQQIKRLNNTTEMDKESAAEATEMYSQCVDWHSEQANQANGANVYLGLMRVSTDYVDFVLDRCSNHALRALDDIGEFNFRISYAELKSYLTSHGQTLLLDKTKSKALGYPFEIGVEGTVGKAKVYVTMGALNESGEFSGSYYYERYRKPIKLSGAIKENKVVLNELDNKSVKQAEWVLEQVGDVWTGSWNGNDGRKVPVRLR